LAYEIILSPHAVLDLKRLRAFDRKAVKEALEQFLRFQPEKLSRSRIKRLRGMKRPQFRLRVDEIRIFYDVHKEGVEVLAIVAKSDADEWLKKEGQSS